MRYFLAQIKRCFKNLPAMLLTAFILSGILGLIVYVRLSAESENESRQMVNLGVVGDFSSPYLETGMRLLQELDNSRFTCRFIQMEESEAQKALERQEINGYLVIPDKFVESVMSGENEQATFVTGTAQNGVGTLLVKELADCVSVVLTESQTGIYAFSDYCIEKDQTENLNDNILMLNLKYFDLILPRSEMFALDTPDSSIYFSYQGYYFCAFLLLFFMFLNIAGCPVLIRNDLSLGRLLSAKGRGSFCQVFSEWGAWCLLMVMIYILVMGMFDIICVYRGISIPEMARMSHIAKALLFFRFLIIIPVVAAVEYFLCQLVSNLVTGILLSFCCVLGLAYISGCFYPISFFPEKIQIFSSVLPAGALMNFMKNTLTDSSVFVPLLTVCLWTGCLLGASCAVRKIRLSGGLLTQLCARRSAIHD